MSSEELLDKCEKNKTEEAIRLIEARVDINKPDTSGFTALMTSCLNNNEKIVDKLLEYGADVNVNIENRAEVNTDTKPAAADGRRSKKKYRKKTPRKKIKSSSTHHGKKSKKQCKDLLQKKIRINILEFKKGRWKSPKQAVAVSYSQIRKRFPECLFPRKK